MSLESVSIRGVYFRLGLELFALVDVTLSCWQHTTNKSHMFKLQLAIGTALILCTLHVQVFAEFGPQTELDSKPVAVNLNEARYPDILKKNYVGFGKMSLSSALQTILPVGLTYKLQDVSPSVIARWDKTNVPFYQVLDEIADHLDIEWHYRDGLIVFSRIGALLEMDKPVVVKTNISVIPETPVKAIPVAVASAQSSSSKSSSALSDATPVQPVNRQSVASEKAMDVDKKPTKMSEQEQVKVERISPVVAQQDVQVSSATQEKASDVQPSDASQPKQTRFSSANRENWPIDENEAQPFTPVPTLTIGDVLAEPIEVLEDQPEVNAPKPAKASKASKAVKTPIPQVLSKTTKSWSIKAGSMLSASIEEWAKQWGWTMLWKVDNDFRIAYSVEITDDFLGGVAQVLDAYSATAHPLWGDAHEVQKLLVIKAADGSAVSISTR